MYPVRLFQEGRKMGYGSMQGIPMVASSPVRHESPIGISPIEVQSYPAPWKALSDFALHQDLDRLDMSTPHFQQIVNQVSRLTGTTYSYLHKMNAFLVDMRVNYFGISCS